MDKNIVDLDKIYGEHSSTLYYAEKEFLTVEDKNIFLQMMFHKVVERLNPDFFRFDFRKGMEMNMEGFLEVNTDGLLPKWSVKYYKMSYSAFALLIAQDVEDNTLTITFPFTIKTEIFSFFYLRCDDKDVQIGFEITKADPSWEDSFFSPLNFIEKDFGLEVEIIGHMPKAYSVELVKSDKKYGL
jgi:hypothetical protein